MGFSARSNALMDNVNPQVAQPVGNAYASPNGAYADPVQTVDPTAAPSQQRVDPSLGQEGVQAPAPTDGTQQQGAPEQQDNGQGQQISPDEFAEIQRQLQEKDTLLTQIRSIADEQRRTQEEQTYRSRLRTELKDAYQRAAAIDDEDRAVEELSRFVDGAITSLTQAYQGQMDEYARDVQSAFWASTKPGFADDLIKQHGLPAAVREDLLQFGNDRDMATYALRVKALTNQFQATTGQQMAQQQAQQMRDSGVFAMGGVSSAPGPEQQLQPGTALELQPALRRIFGMG